MSRAQIGVNVSRCCYQVMIHGGWGGGGGAESQDLCEVLHRVLTLMSVSSLSGGTDSGWMGLKKNTVDSERRERLGLFVLLPRP